MTGLKLLGLLRLPEPGLLWERPDLGWRWSWRHLAGWMSQNWRELALVALLTTVAGLLRIYRVAELPDGLHGDEALTGLDALRILEEGWIGPYVGSGLGQPTGPLFFTALVFWLSTPTLFALHVSMALLGTATIPAAYGLFRLSFGRWVAVMATVALTGAYWHLFFSRSAFMLISMPLLATLATAALLLAVRSRTPWAWGIAGILLGLGVYTYNGYAIFLVAIAAFLGIVVVLGRRDLGRLARGSAVLFLGFFLTAFPLMQFAYSHPDTYFQRHRSVSVLRDPALQDAQSLREQVGFWTGRGVDAVTLPVRHPAIDHSDGMGGRGALDPVLGLFAYVGLAVALRRWRSPPHLLLALVFGAGLAAAVLGLQDWGEYRRAFVMVPFVYGLASLGVVAYCRWVGSLLNEARRKRVTYAVGTAILVIAVGLNCWTYFGRIVHEEHLAWVYASPYVRALDAAHALAQPGIIYMYSSRWSYDYEPRLFLYPDTPGLDRSDQFGVHALQRLHDGPVTYILFPPYDRDLETLRAWYPGGEETVGGSPGGGASFSIYHLP